MSVISLRSARSLTVALMLQLLLLCSIATMMILAEKTDDLAASQTQNVDTSKPNKTGVTSADNPSSISFGESQDADDVIWHDNDPRRPNERFSWSPDRLTGEDINPEADIPWGEEPGGNSEDDVASPSYDKRFMRGFQKRFMRGFQKRFMRGFRSSPSDEFRYPGLAPSFDFSDDSGEWYGPKDKKFMRGFTKRSVPSSESAAGDLDKSASRGMGDAPLEKRFMRGFAKKSEKEDSKGDKSDSQANDTQDTEEEKDKRFMRGFNSFDKRDNELTDDEITGGQEKRFMRGLVKKEDDKRFMRGLVKKEDDKRFMRGFIKKEDGYFEDKRFMRGFTKKDDNELLGEKRLMRGLIKKGDNTEDKRFMRGLIKKDDDSVVEDKRFMRGFTKKDDQSEDKRFMRGLIKKDYDGDEEKRFMRGFTKKDLDKRFMRGLIKKAAEQEDKRFMRGLVKRESGAEEEEEVKHREKRQTRFNDQIRNPLLEKLEEEYSDGPDADAEEDGDESQERWMDYPSVPAKRFMRGFESYAKRGWADRHSRPSLDDEGRDVSKRFMRGFQMHDEDTRKRFVLSRRPGRGWGNGLRYYDDSNDGSEPETWLSSGQDWELRPTFGKRFMRGLESVDKRFIRGLEYYSPRLSSGSRPGLHKKFMRGLDAVRRSGAEVGFEGEGPFLSQSYNRHSQTDFK